MMEQKKIRQKTNNGYKEKYSGKLFGNHANMNNQNVNENKKQNDFTSAEAAWMEKKQKLYKDTNNQPLWDFRKIQINPTDTEEMISFPSNQISSNKYGTYSFLFKSLYEQFLRLPNVWFLIICLLEYIPAFQNLSNYMYYTKQSSIYLLAIFVFVSIVKNVYEDSRRSNIDSQINNRLCHVVDGSNSQLKAVRWMDLTVGSIIRLIENEQVPADILLLSCNNNEGLVYIETSLINGQTNLNKKSCVNETRNETSIYGICNIRGRIICEKPNSNMESFNGSLKLDAHPRATSLSINNVVFKGSYIKNTDYIFGVIIYTGTDTKIMKNILKSAYKSGNVNRELNIYTILTIIFTFICVFISVLCKWTEDDKFKNGIHFLLITAKDNLFESIIKYTLLYSNIIPISILITVDLISILQSVLIENDNRISTFENELSEPSLIDESDERADLKITKSFKFFRKYTFFLNNMSRRNFTQSIFSSANTETNLDSKKNLIGTFDRLRAFKSFFNKKGSLINNRSQVNTSYNRNCLGENNSVKGGKANRKNHFFARVKNTFWRKEKIVNFQANVVAKHSMPYHGHMKSSCSSPAVSNKQYPLSGKIDVEVSGHLDGEANCHVSNRADKFPINDKPTGLNTDDAQRRRRNPLYALLPFFRRRKKTKKAIDEIKKVHKMKSASKCYLPRDCSTPKEDECGWGICLNSNLHGDLGNVDFIFTDKTGTLTSNEMSFNMCSIAGKTYGEKRQKGKKVKKGRGIPPNCNQMRFSHNGDNDVKKNDNNNRFFKKLNSDDALVKKISFATNICNESSDEDEKETEEARKKRDHLHNRHEELRGNNTSENQSENAQSQDADDTKKEENIFPNYKGSSFWSYQSKSINRKISGNSLNKCPSLQNSVTLSSSISPRSSSRFSATSSSPRSSSYTSSFTSSCLSSSSSYASYASSCGVHNKVNSSFLYSSSNKDHHEMANDFDSIKSYSELEKVKNNHTHLQDDTKEEGTDTGKEREEYSHGCPEEYTNKFPQENADLSNFFDRNYQTYLMQHKFWRPKSFRKNMNTGSVKAICDFNDKRIYEDLNSNTWRGYYIDEFFKCMTLCHAVVPFIQFDYIRNKNLTHFPSRSSKGISHYMEKYNNNPKQQSNDIVKAKNELNLQMSIGYDELEEEEEEEEHQRVSKFADRQEKWITEISDTIKNCNSEKKEKKKNETNLYNYNSLNTMKLKNEKKSNIKFKFLLNKKFKKKKKSYTSVASSEIYKGTEKKDKSRWNAYFSIRKNKNLFLNEKKKMNESAYISKRISAVSFKQISKEKLLSMNSYASNRNSEDGAFGVERKYKTKSRNLDEKICEFTSLGNEKVSRSHVRSNIASNAPSKSANAPPSVYDDGGTSKKTEDRNTIQHSDFDLDKCKDPRMTDNYTSDSNAYLDAIKYQSSSLDEECLIYTSNYIGYRLILRNKNTMCVEIDGNLHKWTIIGINEFTNKRGRMSIVVKPEFMQSGSILYVKGSDTSILSLLDLKYSSFLEREGKRRRRKKKAHKERSQGRAIPTVLSSSKGRDKLDASQGKSSTSGINTDGECPHHRTDAHLDAESNGRSESCRFAKRYRQLEKQLRKFSVKGLRTMVFAFKYLNEEETVKYKKMYDDACVSIYNKEEKLEKVAETVETQLTYLGITGVKDRLQKKVSKTIEILGQSGIRIWMLTGDNVEYSLHISFLCKFLNSHTKIFHAMLENTNCKKLKREGKALYELFQLEKEEKKIHEKLCLLINGKNLQTFLNHTDLQTHFLNMACSSDVVIACRITAKQKAFIVQLIKHRLTPTPNTLAIGDGANDIAMLQEANIGVSIMTPECIISSGYADYCIQNFCCLRKLLFIYGSKHLYTMSIILYWNFFKNIVLILPVFFYQAYASWSCVKIYPELLYTFFNIFWIFIPVIYYIFLQHNLNYDVLYNIPLFYALSRRKYNMSTLKFFPWIGEGIFYSIVVFFFAYTALRENSHLNNGEVVTISTFGNICFLGCFLICIVRLFLEGSLWSPSILITCFGFFLFVFFPSILFILFAYISNDYIREVFRQTFMWTPLYILLILWFTTCIICYIFINFVKAVMFPNIYSVVNHWLFEEYQEKHNKYKYVYFLWGKKKFLNLKKIGRKFKHRFSKTVHKTYKFKPTMKKLNIEENNTTNRSKYLNKQRNLHNDASSTKGFNEERNSKFDESIFDGDDVCLGCNDDTQFDVEKIYGSARVTLCEQAVHGMENLNNSESVSEKWDVQGDTRKKIKGGERKKTRWGNPNSGNDNERRHEKKAGISEEQSYKSRLQNKHRKEHRKSDDLHKNRTDLNGDTTPSNREVVMKTRKSKVGAQEEVELAPLRKKEPNPMISERENNTGKNDDTANDEGDRVNLIESASDEHTESSIARIDEPLMIELKNCLNPLRNTFLVDLLPQGKRFRINEEHIYFKNNERMEHIPEPLDVNKRNYHIIQNKADFYDNESTSEFSYTSTESMNDSNGKKKKKKEDAQKEIVKVSNLINRFTLAFKDMQLESGFQIHKKNKFYKIFTPWYRFIFILLGIFFLYIWKLESSLSKYWNISSNSSTDFFILILSLLLELVLLAATITTFFQNIFIENFNKIISAVVVLIITHHVVTYSITHIDGVFQAVLFPLYTFVILRLPFVNAVLCNIIFLSLFIIRFKGDHFLDKKGLAHYIPLFIGVDVFVGFVGYRLEYNQRKNFLLEYSVEASRRKQREILNTMLPPFVVDEMIYSELNEEGIPISLKAEDIETVTIIFCDIYDFQNIVASIEPTRLVEVLDRLFLCFDKCTEQFNCTKIETVFETYLAACGLVKKEGTESKENKGQRDAHDSIDFALSILQVSSHMKYEKTKHMFKGGESFGSGAEGSEEGAAKKHTFPHGVASAPGTAGTSGGNGSTGAERRPSRIRVKIGINSGRIIAGVVGSKKPQYALFGDTVNTASRMKTTGKPDYIHISEATYDLVKDDKTLIYEKKETEIKGKGTMTTYLLTSVIGLNYPFIEEATDDGKCNFASDFYLDSNDPNNNINLDQTHNILGFYSNKVNQNNEYYINDTIYNDEYSLNESDNNTNNEYVNLKEPSLHDVPNEYIRDVNTHFYEIIKLRNLKIGTAVGHQLKQKDVLNMTFLNNGLNNDTTTNFTPYIESNNNFEEVKEFDVGMNKLSLSDSLYYLNDNFIKKDAENENLQQRCKVGTQEIIDQPTKHSIQNSIHSNRDTVDNNEDDYKDIQLCTRKCNVCGENYCTPNDCINYDHVNHVSYHKMLSNIRRNYLKNIRKDAKKDSERKEEMDGRGSKGGLLWSSNVASFLSKVFSILGWGKWKESFNVQGKKKKLGSSKRSTRQTCPPKDQPEKNPSLVEKEEKFKRVISLNSEWIFLKFSDKNLEAKYRAHFYSNKSNINSIEQALIIFLVTFVMQTLISSTVSIVFVDHKFATQTLEVNYFAYWSVRSLYTYLGFILWLLFHYRTKPEVSSLLNIKWMIFFLNLLFISAACVFSIAYLWAISDTDQTTSYTIWMTNDTIEFFFYLVILHHNTGMLFQTCILVDLLFITMSLTFISTSVVKTITTDSTVMLIPWYVAFNLISTYCKESIDRRTFYANESAKRTENRATELLNDMLPKHVLEEFQQDRLKLAYTHDRLTFLFADICGFTSWANGVDASEVLTLLQKLFAKFDNDSTKYGLYKLCTIGDAYVAISEPVTEDNQDYDPVDGTERVLEMAYSMIRIIKEIREKLCIPNLNMRIGLHYGSCVGGVIGSGRLRYDLWGIDVLTGNLMESNGVPGKINVSETLKNFLLQQFKNRFIFKPHSTVRVIYKDVKSFIITDKKEIDATSNSKNLHNRGYLLNRKIRRQNQLYPDLLFDGKKPGTFTRSMCNSNSFDNSQTPNRDLYYINVKEEESNI
ncbi:guanylyl cyclase, putative [Plasmodium knowlesi strain H]|uniref:guanylate cyclase n=3 Tax=Plasmodium knowlesi TaxID=5850 RepID=A0A5K1TX43_PLAKH|nr:guanylyl cyclase, putative [Plasmodium knowlesi strain H]OTN65122.1 putative Guanylyl cyclase [Plasmodium knowlesi]CAA9988409.1 guanylyl cyclase, putative [Plasmodium knowlesi strain H]SBO19904.1 guanylyl cyclase, putative [Plasmodium knowlesi strain H]SBO20385.1 guanylyl cyclase, putative [Plasmodium knowlesi strain H]VVS77883.1 guanylyl cyclase, putative [Plasmodium knowlesi strain H]|eukprot:XP_002259390.1 Guanylyl cyclase, putative [Plasmodium knowlesi strain H]